MFAAWSIERWRQDNLDPLMEAFLISMGTGLLGAIVELVIAIRSKKRAVKA